ncbi:MAG TPA: tRNA (adenosine(37)-N6)-threonylcarbamoyltransferase complex dimerization subunit type 1 TsaB [Acidobacteriaceae bacterium]|nr:tRNA (adenosine(37)-N6)-threonylcarbamoyltransferase complex dimerization subunit type 1 TsaB [Acidobacteriaceae bacterium]
MFFLVFDTAGNVGGVLLAQVDAEGSGSQEPCAFRELAPRQFSTDLVPAVAELLRDHSCRLQDVDVLAVVAGPGSFTGLRVGLSAVKGFAEALSKPIVAVSRLAVMASIPVLDGGRASIPVHAVLDAGRGEFYHGAYREAGMECLGESKQTVEELRSQLTRLGGQIVASEPPTLSVLQDFLPQEIPPVGARQALPLVLRSWQAGRFSDVLKLDANYLRASEAEIISRLALHRQQKTASRHSKADGTSDESAK